MSKHEALPLMRTDISSKNAWAEFSPKFEDSANRRTSTTSLDGFGLAWALHSAERFQEIYGSAPRPRAVFIQDPLRAMQFSWPNGMLT